MEQRTLQYLENDLQPGASSHHDCKLREGILEIYGNLGTEVSSSVAITNPFRVNHHQTLLTPLTRLLLSSNVSAAKVAENALRNETEQAKRIQETSAIWLLGSLSWDIRSDYLFVKSWVFLSKSWDILRSNKSILLNQLSPSGPLMHQGDVFNQSERLYSERWTYCESSDHSA